MKWQYKEVRACRPLNENDLNKYGEDGWELINIFEVPSFYKHSYIFKRPKTGEMG